MSESKILAKEIFYCKNCGAPYATKHHIFPKSIFGKFLENKFKIRLCKECHQEGIEKYITAKIKAYQDRNNEEINRIVVKKDLEKFIIIFLNINAKYLNVSVNKLMIMVGVDSIDYIVQALKQNTKNINRKLKKRTKNAKNIDDSNGQSRTQSKNKNKQCGKKGYHYSPPCRLPSSLLKAKCGNMGF